MPADDLVLNVRQIAGYPPVSGNVPATASLILQLAGLGSAYGSISPAQLVGTALAQGGDMTVLGALSAVSFQSGSGQFANLASNIFSASKACITNLAAGFGTLAGVPIATLNDLAAQYAASVQSFNGRVGNVRLWIDDILCAGGAPIASPMFLGSPRAGTPPPTSNSSRLATTAFVVTAIGGITGAYAPIDSPNFTGVPTAPTPPLGSSDGTLATTAFVQTAIASSVAGVSSFNTRTGIVTLTNTDVTDAGGAVLNSPAFTGTPTAPTPPPGDVSTRLATTAFVLTESGFAPIASPAFTGVPTAPTPTPGTNTTQLATTAYVQAAITGISLGVTTFNGRSGAVTLVANDITAAGGAILASPAFTGTPTAPNPPPGDSSTRIATTAYVQSLAGFAPLASPAFTGVPTGPTAAPGNNTAQLATTAFVEAAVANSTAGVASFNGRTGAVTLQANDITAATGALLASPAFTGTPSGPTAAVGTSSTQLATTAFVMSAGFAPLAAPTFTGVAASTTPPAANNSTRIATTAYVVTALAAYLPLAGGTLTGDLTANNVSATVALLCGQNNLNQNGSTLGNRSAFGVSFVNGAWSATGNCLAVGITNTAINSTFVGFFANSTTPAGTISYAGSSVAYNTTSDDRLKNNQTSIMADTCGSIIDALDPISFSWNADPDGPVAYGFSAQATEAVYPQAVSPGTGAPGDADFQPYGMDASKMVPILVAELQSLRRRVATLEQAA
jgi:hypothetical protein